MDVLLRVYESTTPILLGLTDVLKPAANNPIPSTKRLPKKSRRAPSHCWMAIVMK